MSVDFLKELKAITPHPRHEAMSPVEFKKLSDSVTCRLPTVCQVVTNTEEGPKASGSAFLIGPGLIMTNHHVLPNISTAIKSFIVFFRFFERNGGVIPLEILPVNLVPEKDKGGYFLTGDSLKGELDYTIVGIEYEKDWRKIGESFFSIFKNTVDPEVGEKIFILHHPDIMDITTIIRGSIAISIGAVQSIDKKQNEVHYNTETAGGSSGGCVVNLDGELVALHYKGGGKCACSANNHRCNYGLPIKNILEAIPEKEKKEIEERLQRQPIYPPEEKLERQVSKVQDTILFSGCYQEFEFLNTIIVSLLKEDNSCFPAMQTVWGSFKKFQDILPQLDKTNSKKFLFIKTFRIFTEAIWLQYWLNFQQPKWKDDRKSILTAAEKMIEELPSEVKFENGRLISTIDVKFHLNCIEQAAQCLRVEDESIWQEYQFLGGCSPLSSFHKIYEFLSHNFKKFNLDGWYVDIWNLYSLSFNMLDMEDFQRRIEPKIEKCLKEGKEYTICLAVIFMEFLRNSKTSEKLKQRAFYELKELINLERKSEDLVSFPEEAWSAVIGQPDRFAKTRYLVMEYLLSIVNEGLLFQTESREILLQRREIVKSRDTRQLNEEKRLFEKKKSSIINDIEKLKTTAAMLAPNVRTPEDKTRLEKTKDKILDFEDEEAQIGEAINDIQLALNEGGFLQEISQYLIGFVE